MDGDIYLLAQGLWWSTVGLSYWVYGKRNGKLIAMTCGVLLMVYPYFVGSNLWMLVIGVVLSFIPWRWEV